MGAVWAVEAAGVASRPSFIVMTSSSWNRSQSASYLSRIYLRSSIIELCSTAAYLKPIISRWRLPFRDALERVWAS